MNPMSLPRATLFTIGALVLALLGWGGLIYATASHKSAEKRWTEQRTALETTLAEERKAAGDLAGLRAQIDQANAKLSDRMAVLGEREQDIAAAESNLSGLQQQLSATQAEIDRAKAQVNQRMALLGERERDLAQLQRQRARLDSDAEQAQARLSAAREGLNQRLAVLGERERDLEKLRRVGSDGRRSSSGARAAVWPKLRDQLNGRMVVLREREHDLADRRMQLASLERRGGAGGGQDQRGSRQAEQAHGRARRA